MFPVIRLAKEYFVHRNASPIGILETHVSHHICWPWDIDIWMELNNGRTLTLYDLGRLVMGKRVGLLDMLKSQGWGLAMVGASVRYRRRVRMFERIEMHSRAVCWDERFLYIEQSMLVGDQTASHILYRAAVTDKNGIVPTERVASALGLDGPAPVTPDWISAWITAEAERPWPPEL